MNYKSLFEYRSQADIRIHGTLTEPQKLTEADSIIFFDRYAMDLINGCTAMLETLKEYRIALAARYAELETMPYKRLLKLERNPGRSWGVTYNITITRIYTDGTQNSELSECYTGKQRHIALKRFEELLKLYPGIASEKDIERRSWER